MSKYIKLEDAIEQVKTEFYGGGYQEWLEINIDNLINRIANLPTIEVSEDCISKHDIWKIIEDNTYWVRYNENSTEKGMTLTGINQALNECPLVAPSVVPSRAEGEWKFKKIFPNDDSEFPMGYLVCSVCGSQHTNATPCNYCDNCGAKMKGVEE